MRRASGPSDGTVVGGSVAGGAVVGGSVAGGAVVGGAVVGGAVAGGELVGGVVTGTAGGAAAGRVAELCPSAEKRLRFVRGARVVVVWRRRRVVVVVERWWRRRFSWVACWDAVVDSPSMEGDTETGVSERCDERAVVVV
jgi:hypothetical protein